jgi:hypothetical protein
MNRDGFFTLSEESFDGVKEIPEFFNKGSGVLADGRSKEA